MTVPKVHHLHCYQSAHFTDGKYRVQRGPGTPLGPYSIWGMSWSMSLGPVDMEHFSSSSVVRQPPQSQENEQQHSAWGLAIPKLRHLREWDILFPPWLGALGQLSLDSARKAYPEMGARGPRWLLQRNSRSPCWRPVWSRVDARNETVHSPHHTQASFDRTPWSDLQQTGGV